MDAESSLVIQGAFEETDGASADAALARRIAAGHVDAWDRFFDRFSPWAYRFAYHHLGRNHADAEDLCSEIMMTAARSIGKFDPGRGTLDLWMHGLARHRLSHFCRKRKCELPLIPDIVDSTLAGDSQAVSAPDDTAIARDAIQKALASLPERQASVLIGKYVEGYSTDELARISCASTKAVESLLVRARNSFRAAFRRLTDAPSGGDRHAR